MAPLRDFWRLVDGAALVALEAARRSGAAEAARSGGVQAVLSAALKRAVVTTTDIAGITRGRPLEVSSPQPQDSVVYFHDTPDSAPALASCLGGGAQPSDRHSSEPRPREPIVYFESPAAASGSGLEASQPHGGAVDKDQELDIRLKEEKRELGGAVDKDQELDIRLEEEKRELGNLGGDREGKDPSLHFPREGEQKGPVFDARREEDNSGGGGGGGGDDAGTIQMKRRRPRERRVPSTPIGRAIGFAGLGAGLVWGTIQESAKRIIFGMPQSDNKQSISSPFLSEQNAKRFALALCKMRGAALKVGQMLSIQDESLVPVPILAALDIVRQGADVMPRRQLDAVLDAELGPDWSSKLRSFDYEPLAAASIGQVHRAVLKDGLEVAMKIQYPGVADSIESDIENVRRLLDYTNIIPKGLFLDRAIKVAKEELSRECDYVLEAVNQRRFRELISNSEGFYIPMVIDDISSRKVLTTEFVRGIPIDKVALLNQETRNYVGRKLLELTLKELFVFRFMQTDPNWGNFLYDEPIRMINLIDFGAAREYPQKFVDDYLRMVVACANRDRHAVIEMSQRLGFLTGEENEVMLDAHVQAGFIVGLPFSKPGDFDFRMNNITPSVTNLGATMLKHRLTPPPDEAYSLHRKLSGAFLACIKLGAVVSCRELLFEVYRQHCFSDDNTEVLSSSVA